MDFYGCNDIPLGCFLERYCFRSTYACPSKNCETPMLNHIRRFVHNTGCVSISLRSFADEFLDKNIVTWSWCTKCQNVSPVVPMSSDTWSYSFAKFLELMFYGNVYGRRGKMPCNHSLHHDMYHYFGYRSYVASFMLVDIYFTRKNVYFVKILGTPQFSYGKFPYHPRSSVLIITQLPCIMN